MYFRSLNSPSFPLEITAEKNVQCNLNNSKLKEKKETPIYPQFQEVGIC